MKSMKFLLSLLMLVFLAQLAVAQQSGNGKTSGKPDAVKEMQEQKKADQQNGRPQWNKDKKQQKEDIKKARKAEKASQKKAVKGEKVEKKNRQRAGNPENKTSKNAQKVSKSKQHKKLQFEEQ